MCKLKAVSRLVVKFGTESLSGENGRLSQKIFNDFARQIIAVQQFGIGVAIVSSGAIRAGAERMDELRLETVHMEKKQIAGIGARHLMNEWGRAFEIYGKEVAQIWVTYASLAHNGERKSTKDSTICYLENGVIPIINENDVLSDEEIRWMDEGISENDNLAWRIATLVEADAVLFITSVKGIYKEDSQESLKAEIYEEIDCEAGLEFLDNGHNSTGGSGGIKTKLKAAFQCAQAGKKVAVAGKDEDIIIKFVKGFPVGTKIKNPDRVC
ncbi:MAG: hypothetical protein Q7R99_00445 [bacterium]|nr:hypothetical protein [bacterium]